MKIIIRFQFLGIPGNNFYSNSYSREIRNTMKVGKVRKKSRFLFIFCLFSFSNPNKRNFYTQHIVTSSEILKQNSIHFKYTYLLT